MKSLYQLGFAFALLILMNLLPAPAFASRNTEMGRTHTQTYHDRTPTVHTHGSHPHHS